MHGRAAEALFHVSCLKAVTKSYGSAIPDACATIGGLAERQVALPGREFQASELAGTRGCEDRPDERRIEAVAGSLRRATK